MLARFLPRAVLATAALAALALTAPSARAQSFQTAAPHAILIDADSGSVLFEKMADEPFAPASMAKLMTTEIVFAALKEGKLTMDSEFTVTEDAWKRGGAGGGGRGGHSIGIAYKGNAPPTEKITIQTGEFGAGGLGANAPGNGKDGMKANTLAF